MTQTSSIDPAEVERFSRIAAEWWDPKGKFAPLHRFNPVRLGFIRHAIDLHWGSDIASVRPLAGKAALDVGCGAGLLCEPLARLGAGVTGIDAAPENVAAARAHAAGQGLTIDYRAGELAQLTGHRFDLVTCLEVIEHVADPASFVAGLAGALAPGGLMILSTPNRTPLSRLALISLAEGLGRIPRGTHDWDKFLTPEELADHAAAAGLKVTDTTGITFSPGRGFALGENLALNYLMTLIAA